MDTITELNDFFYAGAKLASNEIATPLRNMNRNTKSKWERIIEGKIKKLQQQAKLLRKVKYTGTQ